MLPLLPLLLLAAHDVDTPVLTGARAPADAAVVVAMTGSPRLPPDPWAGRDADAAVSALLHTRGVPPQRVERLRAPLGNEAAAAIQALARDVGDGGVAWLFWSGWGARSVWNGRPLLLGADVPDEPDRFDAASVALPAALGELAASQAALSVLVLDVSFDAVDHDGAALFDETTWAGPITASVLPRTLVITWSAGAVPEAWSEARHGLLTWLVLGGLRGWADHDRDGALTAGELVTWLPTALRALGRDPASLHVDLAPDAWGVVLTRGRLHPQPPLSPLPEAPASDAVGPVAPPPVADDDDDDAPDDDDGDVFDDDLGVRVSATRRALDDEDRALRDAYAEQLRVQVQAAADEAWAQALAAGARNPEAGQLALRAFIDRFDAITFPLPQGDVVITADQVERARLMLTGGRPRAAHVDAVRLPAGTYRLGADAQPREVTLTTDLLAARDEVSQALWVDLMGDNPSTRRDPRLPVTDVALGDAAAFCNALSRREGLRPAYTIEDSGRRLRWDPSADGWRLPTEAEWEALAGGPWSGFDAPEDACGYANLASPAADADGCDDGVEGLAPLGQRRPNPRGLRDLTGNVAEWTWDAWSDLPPAGVDPVVDRAGSARVVKGGSFLTALDAARTAHREPTPRTTRRPDLGLRVVRTPR